MGRQSNYPLKNNPDGTETITAAEGSTATVKVPISKLPVSDATSVALNGKVNDAQVLTDVPLGAVFTDTDTIYDDSAIQAKVDLNTAKVTNYNHSPAEIKSLYESNADTNEFSNALLSKLNGISSGTSNKFAGLGSWEYRGDNTVFIGGGELYVVLAGPNNAYITLSDSDLSGNIYLDFWSRLNAGDQLLLRSEDTASQFRIYLIVSVTVNSGSVELFVINDFENTSALTIGFSFSLGALFSSSSSYDDGPLQAEVDLNTAKVTNYNQPADETIFTPDGDISSSNVQSAIVGVRDDTDAKLLSKEDKSNKGVANGYASLDGGGKLPASQLTTSAQEYLGNWAASSNTPTLANGSGTNGDTYRATDSGSVNFGAGSISFLAGDWVIYNGTIWEKSVNSNEVVSVNGKTSVVIINPDDLDDTSTTNKFTTSGDISKLAGISPNATNGLNGIGTWRHKGIGGGPISGNFNSNPTGSTPGTISISFTDFHGNSYENIWSNLLAGDHLIFRSESSLSEFRDYEVTSVNQDLGYVDIEALSAVSNTNPLTSDGLFSISIIPASSVSSGNPLIQNTLQSIVSLPITVIDLSLGSVIILIHDVPIASLSFSNIPDVGEWIIRRKSGASVSIVWDSSIIWSNQSPPIMSIVSDSQWRFVKTGASESIFAFEEFSESNTNYQLSVASNDIIDISTWNSFDASKISDPVYQPSGIVSQIAYSHDGLWLAVTSSSYPKLTIYDVLSGFVKETDPSIMPSGDPTSCAFSPDNQYLAISIIGSPYLIVYNVGSWTQVSTGISLSSNAHDVSFSSDSSMIAIGDNDGLKVYDTSTWSLFSVVGGIPAGGTVKGVSFNHLSTEISCVNDAFPRFTRYSISSSIITKQPTPANTPASQCERLRYSNGGDLIVVSTNGSPYIFIYDTADFSKVTDPLVLPSSSSNDVAFSADDSEVAIASLGTPGVVRYKTSDWSVLPSLVSPSTGSGLSLDYNRSLK